VVAGAVLPPPFVHYPTHVGFALVVLYGRSLAFRFDRPASPARMFGVVWDIVLMALTVAACGYIAVNYEYVLDRFIWFDPLSTLELALASAMTLVLLEAARRTVGWGLVSVVLIFIAYVFVGPYLPDPFWHRGQGGHRLLEQLYLSPDGIWNEPVKVTANYIFLFVLLGAFLMASGAGEFFIDIARALTGRTVGGPAKTAVVTSALMGMLQGSSAGNVVTTGPFTIPAMRKAGYRPEFSAGVEAVASTGGQLTPPIMGAAAFLMIEFVGIPYSEVMTIAILPAALYFVAVFATVDFEARKLRLRPLADDVLPRARDVLKRRFHLLLPLAVMIGMLFQGYTPTKAGFWSVVCLFALVVVADREARSRIGRIVFQAMTEAPRMIAPVTVACAIGGMIAGIIVMTGLGLRLSSIILDFSGGNLLVAMVLTMFAALVLGMGMPTSAAVIILAALLAPGLVDLGVPLAAAHLFIIYCASKSAITPPVAVASYAAAAIADTDPWRTSLVAFRLGLSVFIIPYMFVDGPELLMIGSAGAVVWSFLTASFGVVVLSAATTNWLLLPLKAHETLLLLSAAVAMIYVDLQTDLLGFLLAGLAATSILIRRRIAKTSALESGGSAAEERS
ncbi:MAG: TRAP transporter fused permease subunit, partial [Alphaproteobacteria bacterium]